MKDVTANDRIYPAPRTCAIAICLDGCEPAYIDAAIDAGVMPTMKRIRETGTMNLAHCVIPSFTNPNNMSIATGQPPAVHGICGNFLLDPETGTRYRTLILANGTQRPILEAVEEFIGRAPSNDAYIKSLGLE